MARPSGEHRIVRTEFGHRLSARLARAALRVGGPALEYRNVGHALLVHPRGFVDSQALTFAQRLAADPQHTLVVLDLPASPEGSVWETVARALDRRGRSFRLVPGRGTREDVKHAAQWLADRLERVVLAPDGAVLPAAGGALFVPAQHGLGWLRYGPNLPSMPDSRRFPKPQWEFSVPDGPQPTGAGGVVEPLPGGVWIRGTWEDAAAPTHRQRLVNLMAVHPDLLAVAIGSPGTSALPVEEITAFWHALPSRVRPLVRFVSYGPVAAPDGASFGQALADLLGQRIAVYAGLPVPGVEDGVPQVRTLRRDGTLGWRPYADEFGFMPRSKSDGRAPAPVALNTRAPLGAVPAVAPGVYQYAPDVVLEVVQSGLWVRPPAEPHDGHAVRSAPADPACPAVLYDGTNPMAADRMRFIAYELLSGLDPSFGRRGRIMPSSEAGRFPGEGHPLHVADVSAALAEGGPTTTVARPASGRVQEEPPSGREAVPLPPVDAGTWADDPPAPAAHSDAGAGPESVPPRRQPSLEPRPDPSDPQPRREALVPDAERPVPGPEMSEVEPVATGQGNAAPVSPPPTPAASAAPVPTPAPPSTTPHPEPAMPKAPAPEATSPGAPRIRLESPMPGPLPPSPQPPAQTTDDTGDAAPDDGGRVPEPAAAPPTHPSGQEAGEVLQAQSTPSAAASVLPPEKGVDRERDWVRRSLGERYDTAVAFVSRVLSESPGLHGGPRSSVAEALTDLAAIRLYLSGATWAIDAAIRAGTAGPHVPLARCAASGLRRLPSYRGATMVRTTLTAAERGWYQEGKVVTENSFLAAVSTVRRGMPGNTDVLVWSLTARRTALVAPDLPDRVLFAPGTRFKVLRTEGGDRPVVMLRELAAAEFDEHGRTGDGRVPLDEIALAGLEQVRGFWTEAEKSPDGRAGEPLSEEHTGALCAAPGLRNIGRPGGPPRPAPSPGTVPQKGTKP
ncbi:hypothetical protein AB0D74_43885 [Streptomyces sp. NPDC048278]|uniref:hypothetical protein n=1 Tax=Streptomyces sp. NPDC048278 TaxID=3155809 RepID=UPI003415CCA5